MKNFHSPVNSLLGKAVLLVSVSIICCSAINSNVYTRYTVFSFSDSSINHVVKILILNKNRVSFEMRLINKKSGKVCFVSGEAVHHDAEGVEIDTDENGVGYESTAYNFLSKDKSTFISLRFQGVQNLSNSRRLQINSSKSSEGCDYDSKNYILLRK